MTQFYSIHCKTHLHVGSGDSNYGVIDKLIQRDPATQTPCIFASSLKGAFREYFKIKNGDALTDTIFGKSEKSKTDKSKLVFHQAYTLSIPIRSNKVPYFNMTSPNAIDDLVELLEMLEKSAYLTLISELSSFKKQAQKGKLVLFHQPIEGLHIEDFDESEIVFDQSYNVPKSISTLFGDQPVLADNEHYLEMCSDYRLPVIARNNLENGQSKNLWYEQIMPRASRFFFAVTPLDEPICIDFFSEFKEERFVQIGANATIGYGVCSIVPF